MEVHMDDMHGFGADPQVLKFKDHIWFRDGGVHPDGAEYDHLQRFRKRLHGAVTIESIQNILTLHSSCWGWKARRT